MDHVVYVDARANEMEKLLSKEKSMILRGATGRKMPYGRVDPSDVLYFINNNAEGIVKAKGKVTEVLNSVRLTPAESADLVKDHQNQLQLTPVQVKRWAGKRYLVLITISDVKPVKPFSIDRSQYGNMDDWLPVGDIEAVKVGTDAMP
jgi:hypothetical protein